MSKFFGAVIRRVGGLEEHGRRTSKSATVIRRVGG